jgi:hypothetical protein
MVWVRAKAWWTQALREDRCLPAAVRGPVDLLALARLAAILRAETRVSAMWSSAFLEGPEAPDGGLETADGGGFESGEFADGSAGSGFTDREMVERFGVDLTPSGFDGFPVIGHFDVDGGGFQVAEAERAPEVADGLFGEKAFEVIGRLDDGLGGVADEGEAGGVLEVEEHAGAGVGELGAVGLALEGAWSGGLGCRIVF